MPQKWCKIDRNGVKKKKITYFPKITTLESHKSHLMARMYLDKRETNIL